MPVSSLASQTIQSPNCSQRTASVEAIIVHYMAGDLSAVACAQMFANSARQASSQYCIGSDGDIVCSCDEQYRAWTSGSDWADSRGITIEVASQPDGSITDAAWKACVDLCADVAKRYGLHVPFRFTGDTSGELWAHRWFQATACPGDWFYARFPQLAADIAAKVSGKTPDPQPQPSPTPEKKWRIDGKAEKGAKIKSGRYRPDPIPGMEHTCICGDEIYIKEFDPYFDQPREANHNLVPLAWLKKIPGSDGYNDGHIHNSNAVVETVEMIADGVKIINGRECFWLKEGSKNTYLLAAPFYVWC